MLRRLSTLCLLLLPSLVGASEPAWQQWSDEVFTRARAQGKFVLLDLGAVWCHWCHVMQESTYRDPKVVALLESRFIAVRADQDADPALSRRYEEWGWPATIILAADGTEIVKRRGYLPPPQMAALLAAVIEDPSPGPSVQAETPWQPSSRTTLDPAARIALERRFAEVYDKRQGGWGRTHRFLDAEAIDYALIDPRYKAMARRTLDGTLKLIDPVWGGLYQYSDTLDWSSPHYEKLMSFQAAGIRLYLAAHRRFGGHAYLDAARAIARYIDAQLSAPNGSFYVSQDADLDAETPGKRFYALDDAARKKAGTPRVDTHIYPRENGWAIAAFANLGAATADPARIERARRVADLITASHRLPDGTFRHGDSTAGPYLGDTLAMAQAFARLHAATSDATFRDRALAALRALDVRFRHPEAGYQTSLPEAGARGVFARPPRVIDENVEVARLALELGQLAIADQALHFLTSASLPGERPFAPGVLAASRERAAYRPPSR